MPTPAYTEYDSTKPDGATSPTTYASDDLNNQRALRDSIIGGRVKGFVQSRTNGTGTANQPQYIAWLNATLSIGVRMNLTWTGFTVSSLTWEWSNDNGATWTAMGSAQANTYDGSNNVTASTNSGGFINLVFEIWTKCLKVVSDFAAHIAATGTAVHGLGTAAVANLTAMVIGGTSSFDGTGGIGQTTRMLINARRVVEDVNVLAPALNAGVTLDWNYGGSDITVNGTHAITFSNVPAGMAGHIVYVNNFNSVTWPASVNWGLGGRPSIAGVAGVTLITDNTGTNVQASINWRAV